MTASGSGPVEASVMSHGQMPEWYMAEAQPVYDAQEATEYRLTDYEVDVPEGWDECLTVDEVEPFARAAMTAAGWGDDGPPLRFAFDVPDESELAGWFRHPTGTIHLHPRLLSRMTILHEMAHFLEPREAHGPRFVAYLANLVAAVFGPGACGIFIEECVEREVPIDYWHLDP